MITRDHKSCSFQRRVVSARLPTRPHRGPVLRESGMGMRFSVPSLALHLSPSHLCAACVCRPEMVVGWYHSHPGFGCWLSGVDINTQQVGGVKWCPGRLALGIHFDCTASSSKSSCAEGAREPSCFNCCCQAAEVLIPLPLAVTAPPAHAIHLLAHFPPPPQSPLRRSTSARWPLWWTRCRV